MVLKLNYIKTLKIIANKQRKSIIFVKFEYFIAIFGLVEIIKDVELALLLSLSLGT